MLVLDAIARALTLDLFDLLPALDLDEADGARWCTCVSFRSARSRAFSQHSRTAQANRAGGRGRRLALIGLRGAGKSTLGAMLAERLGCPFIELDKMVEREHGAPVATLFEVYGQATFRRYERDASPAWWRPTRPP